VEGIIRPVNKNKLGQYFTPSAQPPNTIPVFKLAQVCAKLMDNKEFGNFTTNYSEVDWKLENDKLVCKEAHFACLFKAPPEQLCINWAAATQFQFHACDLDQTLSENAAIWAKNHLKHFVKQTKKRADDMVEKFVKPFEKYTV
jgi:type II restriction enzyme